MKLPTGVFKRTTFKETYIRECYKWLPFISWDRRVKCDRIRDDIIIYINADNADVENVIINYKGETKIIKLQNENKKNKT